MSHFCGLSAWALFLDRESVSGCSLNANWFSSRVEVDLRRIPLSRRSHVTGFQALSTGTAEHESALERDFVTLTAFLDAGAEITAQPVTIRFDHEGRERRYTPDFLVRTRDGHASLVEIKYRRDLRTQWMRLRPAFAAARRWAVTKGASFRIVTESAIRGPRLDTAKRLLPLRTAPIDAKLAAATLDIAGRLDRPTFGMLVDAVPASREVALAIVWRLVARGQLRVDLSAPIARDTRIAGA
jgi:hypothetical protein